MKRPVLFLFGLFLCGYAWANPLPKLEGWAGPDNVESYKPETLFERINGAAPSYHACGFKNLWAAEYSTDGGSISLEIYRHANPAMAFGIYSQERSRHGSFFDAGLEAYQYKSFAAFVSGPYYVRIDLYEWPDRLNGKLTELVAEIEKGLGVADPSLAPLSVFPAQNQVAHSAAYRPESFLGRPALAGTYETTYAADGRKWHLFFTPKSSAGAGLEALQGYLAAIKDNQSMPVGQAVRIEDPYTGPVYFWVAERGLFGAYGSLADDAARKALAEMAAEKDAGR